MSRVLVTGAAGFIGSHLCEALLARGDDVLGVDAFTENYSPGRKRANLTDALAAGLEFRRLDLTCDGLDPVLRGIDVVYHLAAQPGVRSSWGDDFDIYARRNLVATSAGSSASTSSRESGKRRTQMRSRLGFGASTPTPSASGNATRSRATSTA